MHFLIQAKALALPYLVIAASHAVIPSCLRKSNCDLNGIYTLLRRKARPCCPNNLDGDVSSSIDSSNNSGTTNRKRKRGNDGDSVSEVTMTGCTVKTEI